MSLIKAGYGSLANTLLQEISNGTFRVTSNEELFVDIDNKRLSMSSLVQGYTEAQIKALAVANILRKIYISSDTLKLFWYDTTSSEWVVVGGDHVALADLATRATNDGSGNNIVNTYETKADASTKKAELDQEIADLETAISQIHSFEIRKVNSKEDLPYPGTGNIIYLVPSTTSSQANVYDEYIWITDETIVPYGGYYENIGTSEAALDNYYTKAQIDARVTTINTTISNNDTASQQRDTTLQGNIDTLTSTVATNKTASENADTALGGRIDTLSATVTANDTASQSRDTTLQGNIDTLSATVTANKTSADATQSDLDTLEADVATIHRFNTWYGLELPAVAEGDPYTIYFVVNQNPLIGQQDKYSEYIFVPQKVFTQEIPDPEHEGQTIEDTITIPAHYERIDSTVDFFNYYTKAEVDAIATALQTNITANSTAITDLTGVVATNKTASESRDAALDTRVTAVEEAIGSGGGTGSLTDRMAAAEQAIIDNKATSDAAEEALDGRLDDVEAAIGDAQTAGTILYRLAADETAITTNDTASQSRDTALGNRLTTVEGAIGDSQTADTIIYRIDALETDLAAQVSKEAEDYTELDSRIDANDDDIDALDGRLDTVEAAIGSGSDVGSLVYRMTAAEGRLDTDESALTTLTGRVTTAEGNISTMDTAYKAADTTLQANIDALAADVATINRFNVVFVDSFEDLPEVGDKFVIYFVPAEDPSEDHKYNEYMWVVEDDEHPEDGYYEQVDSTYANLDNYYTKTQIDTTVNTINNTITTNDTASQSRDTALGNRITSLETTMGPASTSGTVLYRLAAAETDITANKATSDAAEAALDGRVSDLEDIIGTGGGQGSTITARLAAAEQAIIDNKATSDAAEEALDGRLDDVEAAIGDAQTAGTLEYRMGAAETAITTNDTASQTRDTALGNRITALETVVGDAQTANTLVSRMDSAETDIEALQDLVGDGTGSGQTIMNRLSAAEDDIDDIETELGQHNWLYAGSATEGGAATNVVETSVSANGYQDVLIAGSQHNSVEYAAESKAQINPSTGALKVSSIVLGGATLVFDSTTESLVVNF